MSTARAEEELATTDHLSFSRLDRYLHCPEQYRLYYIENLRPKLSSANLAFGQIQHQALALMFREGLDPVKYFLDTWQEARDAEIKYTKKDSWEKLNNCGKTLLEKFVENEAPQLTNIRAIEKSFELFVTGLESPLIGFIDLVAERGGQETIIDFKTSASAYAGYEAIMSDQLTAYQLAEPDAQRLGLCVLIKAKEPRIEWHLSHRSGEQLLDYLRKVGLVAREIKAGHFYKRPGKWCAWCDYLPVCLGDASQVKRDFVRNK
jgi:RecB family exonuclease